MVPSPVFSAGLLFLTSPSTRLIALRPDGAGDVTKTHVAWTREEKVPDIASPVSDGDLVFTVDSSGMVVCSDVKDGKKVWQKDLDMEVESSPGIMGGRLFLLGKEGTLAILNAGRAEPEIARFPLPDKFYASPAFAGGHVFLRGATNLYCLGPESAKLAKQP